MLMLMQEAVKKFKKDEKKKRSVQEVHPHGAIVVDTRHCKLSVSSSLVY
jgi:hypothetical protein